MPRYDETCRTKGHVKLINIVLQLPQKIGTQQPYSILATFFSLTL